MDRRILLISTFNYSKRPWNGVCYEFVEVVRQLEDATVVAPAAAVAATPFNASVLDVVRSRPASLRRMARDIYQLHRGGLFERTALDGDYDVCIFMCQFLRELPNLEQVQGWRRRSRRAVAFILETWTNVLAKSRDELALLDQFDHVFVLNQDSMAALQRHTRTPVSFLPTAADCLAATPAREPAVRPVDVLCLGRRLPAVHRRMLDIAEARGWFYLFDLWANIEAQDWAQVRAANAGMVRRSRYFIVFDAFIEARNAALIGSDRPLTTRYFEAAAGGAIMLGSRTPGRDFSENFDWPDALVEIAPDGSDLEAVLDALEADPARCRAVRHANMVESLRRHDWGHRWQAMLATLGLPLTAGHRARLAALEARARGLEAAMPAAARRARPAPGGLPHRSDAPGVLAALADAPA